MKKHLVFLWFFFPLVNMFSQSTTGNIEGWILDSNNKPVFAVNITVVSPELQGSRGVSTDERGYYLLTGLPIGQYSLKISHITFQQVNINNVRVLLGQTTEMGEVKLKEREIETEQIVIRGEQIINTRSTTNGKNISSEQFYPLPIARNFFHIAELLPHANLTYKGDRGTNFAGGTGIENRYFIDGAEVTEPEMGLLRFELPYNFIREVEIKTGGYQAEYNGALGGNLNTVTLSGGNEIHGSIFGFFTGNNFSRESRTGLGLPPEGDYSSYDIGFGIGGPIVRDHLWFFAAYDPDVTSEEVYVRGLNMQQSSFTRHKFAAKLTWGINQKNMLTLSVIGNPYESHQIINRSPTMEVLNEEFCNRDVSYFISNTAIKGIHHLTDNCMLQSSFSYGIMDGKLKPSSPEGSKPSFVDLVSGTASGGQGFTTMNPAQKLLNGSIKAMLVLQDHIIKAGMGYSYNSTKNEIIWKYFERRSKYYWRIDEIITGTVKQRNFSGFIQDSWQITPRLCMNAGIRWDPQWLIASDGSVAQKITDQVQPRIGIIYQPGILGTQKITASFGRFYQPMLLSMSTLYHLRGVVWSKIRYPNDPRVDTSEAMIIPSIASFITNIPDLEGQYFDEFSIGYERILSTQLKFAVRGIYRYLGQGIEDGVVSEQDQKKYGSLQVYGNPGSGMLSMLPEMKREYTALEITLEHFSNHFKFLFSYVLSRNRGNYDGLATTYDESGGASIFPNNTNQFGIPERMVNSEGLLPNDRTHVFKMIGSYYFDFGLTAGIVFQWMSGTPLNEFGIDSTYYLSTFLRPRGTAGRTPSIWDLNFRFIYDVSKLFPIGLSSKLIMDLLHVASQRTELDYEQYHYNDYEQQDPNPYYMVPIQFQPPMSLRLGMEINF